MLFTLTQLHKMCYEILQRRKGFVILKLVNIISSDISMQNGTHGKVKMCTLFNKFNMR